MFEKHKKKHLKSVS